MTFSVLEHLDKLEPTKTKNKYRCPVCNGNNLSIEPSTGKYQCWNGCELKDIREALSPARKPSSDNNNKIIPSPKNKPIPVAIDVKSELKPIKLSFTLKMHIETLERKDGNRIYWHHGYNLRAIKQVNPKKFIGWEHRNGNEWEKGYGGYTPEIMGLQICLSHGCKTVIGLEGQKDTINALRIGIPAIDIKNPAGREDYKAQLIEAKERGLECIILPPDNDEPGVKQSSERANLARECGIMAIVLNAPTLYGNMTKGYDFTDWVNDNGDDFDYVSAIEKQMMAVLEKYDSQSSDDVSASDSNKKSSKGNKITEAIDAIKAHYVNRIRLNQLTSSIEKDGELYDTDTAYIDIAKEIGLELRKEAARDFVVEVAKENAYHPVLDYLNSLPLLDASENLDDVVTGMASRFDVILGGIDKNDQIKLVKTMVGAVARAYEPGCQMRTVCVLYGHQLAGKSTFWRELASEPFFGESYRGTSEKDDLLALHRAWIHEIAEIDAIYKKTDSALLKHLISARQDEIRKPYAASSFTYKRRCILVASTNKQDFLRDTTGNTRFLTVLVAGTIDIPLLKATRDDLWSMAVHLYRNGYSHWLTTEEQAASEATNEMFTQLPDHYDEIREFCERHGKDGNLADMVSGKELWDIIFPDEAGKSPYGQKAGDIRKVMEQLGYRIRQVRTHDGRKPRLWCLSLPHMTHMNSGGCNSCETPMQQGIQAIASHDSHEFQTFTKNDDEVENILSPMQVGESLANHLSHVRHEAITIFQQGTHMNSHEPESPESCESVLFAIATPKNITGTYIGTKHPYTDEKVASAEKLADGSYLVKFRGRTTAYKVPTSDFIPDQS